MPPFDEVTGQGATEQHCLDAYEAFTEHVRRRAAATSATGTTPPAQEARRQRKEEASRLLSEGEVLDGTVASVTTFGLFVDVGVADGEPAAEVGGGSVFPERDFTNAMSALSMKPSVLMSSR